MKKTKLLVVFCLGATMGFAQNNFTSGYSLYAGNNTGVYGYTSGITTSGAAAIGNDIGVTRGMVVNALGETYIADEANNVVLKVDLFGTITVIAGIMPSTFGSGGGYNGDGGPANAALLNNPTYLALNYTTGDLYINDWGNNIIRKVKAIGGTITSGSAHTISTVAGIVPTPYTGGSYGHRGLGFINTCGQCGGPSCGDAGPATAATFYFPTGIAVDGSGNLFIIDGNVIREVTAGNTDIIGIPATTTSGFIYTVVGTGGQLSNSNPSHGNNLIANDPSVIINPAGGIAFDATYSNLYFTDASSTNNMNNTIRRINLTNTIYKGHIYWYAGSGLTASSNAGDGLLPIIPISAFNSAEGIPAMAIDANNNIYVDLYDNLGNIGMLTYGGTFYTLFTNIVEENGLAVDACGNLYFNNDNGVLVEKALNGTATTFAPHVTVPAAVCSGSAINATGTSGSSASTVYPDSYTWNLIPTYASGVSSGVAGISTTISNPTSNSTSYSFPTAQLPCSTYCIIELTVTKKCPVATTVTYTSPVIFINCNPTPVITGSTSVCSGGSTTLCALPSGSPYSTQWYTGGGTRNIILSTQPCLTESPAANTTYNVSVTNSTTGCVGTASQLVTVQNIQPEFSLSSVLSSSSDHFYNITVPAGYTYLTPAQDPTFKINWTVMEVAVGSAGPTYVPVSPNTSEVTSCSDWNALPGTANSFNGYVSNLTSPYNNYGTVTGNTIGSSPNYSNIGSFKTGHEYAVTLATSSSTCPNVTPLTLTTYQSCSGCRTAGVETQIADETTNVAIYPNPNNGNFTIETPIATQQLVEVYDLTGRAVLSQNISGTSTINAAGLTDGIYNLKISGTDNVVNKRIVITN